MPEELVVGDRNILVVMKTHQIVSFQAGVVYSVNFHRLEKYTSGYLKIEPFLTGSLSLEFWIVGP